MAHDLCLTFDFGMKSIGVAIGQSVSGTASPLSALKAQDGIPDWSKIDALLQEWKPTQMLVGLPLNMDGTEQHLTQCSKKFARRLRHKFNLPVHEFDERLSTADAKQKLFELGGVKKLKKDLIDSVSACLIYETWRSNFFD